MRSSLLFLLLFLSFHAFGNETINNSCEEKMVSTVNMPKNNVQGNLDWCFAWTSTELLSFYEEIPLSSYDLALQYHNHGDLRDESVKDYTNVGGDNAIALYVAIQSSKGLCREDQTNFTNSDWKKLSELFKKLSSPKKKLMQVICQEELIDTQPFVDLDADVLLILNQLSQDKKVAALLDVTCKERHRLKHRYGVGSRDIEKFPASKLIDKLDEMLTKKEPATVVIDFELIKNASESTSNDDNHAATIIGKRPNELTGECEYLLKYTGGDKCPNKKKIDLECVDGNFWIPKKTLEKNIFRVDWLVKSNKK